MSGSEENVTMSARFYAAGVEPAKESHDSDLDTEYASGLSSLSESDDFEDRKDLRHAIKKSGSEREEISKLRHCISHLGEYSYNVNLNGQEILNHVRSNCTDPVVLGWLGDRANAPNFLNYVRFYYTWNTMRRVDYQEIPWIMISPVIENQPVWNYFRDPANMGRIAQIAQNRIICPYIVPDNANRNHLAPAPFPALTLALSLILLIARVRATVHLAACLGFDAESRDLRSPQDRLKCEQQYAYTLDGSRMTTHDMPIAPQDIDVWNNFRQVVNQF
ncbi:hypothetical protein AGOR_G00015900 [Albula goreensis]|uniref:Uncharacterized protein n=1 Tax=Albula goreensis TaxID=1534307 RepID=A0A8T3E8S9_9TELE|nr:hypothetical protein AGOR_G00015900 [Albula goreensis]